MKEKERMQKGERDFIDGVVKAVLERDTSSQHFLINDKGTLRYVKVTFNGFSGEVGFGYINGEHAKILCIFGEYLIEDFHYQFGDHELSIPWIRKSVQEEIEEGRKVADIVF